MRGDNGGIPSLHGGMVARRVEGGMGCRVRVREEDGIGDRRDGGVWAGTATGFFTGYAAIRMTCGGQGGTGFSWGGTGGEGSRGGMGSGMREETGLGSVGNGVGGHPQRGSGMGEKVGRGGRGMGFRACAGKRVGEGGNGGGGGGGSWGVITNEILHCVRE